MTLSRSVTARTTDVARSMNTSHHADARARRARATTTSRAPDARRRRLPAAIHLRRRDDVPTHRAHRARLRVSLSLALAPWNHHHRPSSPSPRSRRIPSSPASRAPCEASRIVSGAPRVRKPPGGRSREDPTLFAHIHVLECQFQYCNARTRIIRCIGKASIQDPAERFRGMMGVHDGLLCD